MKPTSFPEANLVIARDQPEYLELPAHRSFDDQGIVTTYWKLTWRERLKLLVTGKLWFQQMTFCRPLQPQRPGTDKPL